MIWFGKSFIKFCKSFINLIKLVSTRICSSARVRGAVTCQASSVCAWSLCSLSELLPDQIGIDFGSAFLLWYEIPVPCLPCYIGGALHVVIKLLLQTRPPAWVSWFLFFSNTMTFFSKWLSVAGVFSKFRPRACTYRWDRVPYSCPLAYGTAPFGPIECKQLLLDVPLDGVLCVCAFKMHHFAYGWCLNTFFFRDEGEDGATPSESLWILQLKR